MKSITRTVEGTSVEMLATLNELKSEIYAHVMSSEHSKFIVSVKIKQKRGVDVEIPLDLRTPEFIASWQEWKSYRSQSKATLTPITAKKQLDLMSRLGAERAIASIQQSILNGWQGLFEPRATSPVKSEPSKPIKKEVVNAVTNKEEEGLVSACGQYDVSAAFRTWRKKYASKKDKVYASIIIRAYSNYIPKDFDDLYASSSKIDFDIAKDLYRIHRM